MGGAYTTKFRGLVVIKKAIVRKMNDLFSRYSLRSPDCVALLFSVFYDACVFPERLPAFDWSSFVKTKIPGEVALAPYDSKVVLWSMLTAFPDACCKTSEIVNILYYTDPQITRLFDKAQSERERRYMYVWVLRFTTNFLLALHQSSNVQFGKSLFRHVDPAALNKLSGKPYVDEFAYDSRNGTEAVAKITAATGDYTLKSFANILNGLTPIMASLAHFNPNGAQQERRTNDLLSKTRKYFDDKIASGELHGFAAIGAKALPDSAKRFTAEQYSIKVAQRKREMTQARYDAEHKRIQKIKNKDEKKSEDAALEERRKREVEIEKNTFEQFSNVVHKSSLEKINSWLLRNKSGLSKIERKRDAIYRNLFKYAPTHDHLYTMLARLSMMTELPTMLPGVIATFSPLIQPIIRQISRPELYVLLSRILGKLPVQPDINTYITYCLNTVQFYVEPLKPFLPLFEHILRYTYPIWSRFYTYIMNFVTQTANFMLNKVFPALPSQRTITIATNTVAEVATGAIQLAGFVFRSYEMINLGLAEMALRILWFIIKNFGVKIVMLIAAA